MFRTISRGLRTAAEARKIQELGFQTEKCILIDENDKALGPVSKVDAHKVVAGQIPLHRAFSVLVFNKNGDFLMQERSRHKITYPKMFTNSCCSHPFFDIDGTAADPDVVRVAAQRRLNVELGIPLEQIPLDDLKFVTRFYYKHLGDGTWGEHEISYAYILQKDVDIHPNPDEVESVRFISRKNYRQEISNLPGPLTPWFQHLFTNCLERWWKDLETIEKHHDAKNILRF